MPSLRSSSADRPVAAAPRAAVPQAAPQPTDRGRWAARVRAAGPGWLLLLPTVAAVVAVSIYPVARSLSASFTDEATGHPHADPVGLDNYARLAADPLFLEAWWHTIVFTAATTVAETVLGMLFALVLNEAFRGRGLVRALVIIPWAIPTVVSAKLAASLFDASTGPVNYIATRIGLADSYVDFLGDPGHALWTLVVTDVWKSTPFMALLILAGLQAIPGSLVESARIDGAGPLRTFFSIKLPLLMPALLVAALLRALDAFRIFDLPYVLTGGGPAGATEVLSTYGYKTMFSGLQVGYGSAITTATFVTEALIAAVFGLFIAAQYRRREG